MIGKLLLANALTRRGRHELHLVIKSRVCVCQWAVSVICRADVREQNQGKKGEKALPYKISAKKEFCPRGNTFLPSFYSNQVLHTKSGDQ